MAKMPTPGASPTPDMDDDASPAEDSTDTGDASAPTGTVLCTIMDNGDGTYTLIKGDEDDVGAGSADSDAGAATGATAAGAGSDADDSGSDTAGQTYDSVGALLKGVLDIVNEAESSAGGEGSSDDQFSAGFNGDSSPTPAKPAMSQKY